MSIYIYINGVYHKLRGNAIVYWTGLEKTASVALEPARAPPPRRRRRLRWRCLYVLCTPHRSLFLLLSFFSILFVALKDQDFLFWANLSGGDCMCMRVEVGLSQWRYTTTTITAAAALGFVCFPKHKELQKKKKNSESFFCFRRRHSLQTTAVWRSPEIITSPVVSTSRVRGREDVDLLYTTAAPLRIIIIRETDHHPLLL